MGIKRRSALKGLLVAGAAAVGVRPARAAVARTAPPDAVGLLYDATKCIGCKACVSACREVSGLDPDPGTGTAIYHAPVDLSERAKTVVKLYANGREQSFVKVQCMQCVDPACTTACMLGALEKREQGVVTYRADLCIGCRYCQMACPFNVPKFEWAKAMPKIVKCELCPDRRAAGKQPACTEVCPRGAVVYGTRAQLLEEAKRRIAAEPAKYVPKVYGETDGGGTQVLYLSAVPFEALGFPTLSSEAAPAKARAVQHTIYRGFLAPAAMYGLLTALTFRSRRSAAWRAPQPSEGEKS